MLENSDPNVPRANINKENVPTYLRNLFQRRKYEVERKEDRLYFHLKNSREIDFFDAIDKFLTDLCGVQYTVVIKCTTYRCR